MSTSRSTRSKKRDLENADDNASPPHKKAKSSNESNAEPCLESDQENHKLVIFIRPSQMNDRFLPNTKFSPTMRITTEVSMTLESRPWSRLVTPSIEKIMVENSLLTKFEKTACEPFIYLRLPAVSKWDGEENLIIATDEDFVTNVPFLEKSNSCARFPNHYYLNAWWREKRRPRQVPQESKVGDEATESDADDSSTKPQSTPSQEHEHELTRTAVQELTQTVNTDYKLGAVACDECLMTQPESAYVYHCTKNNVGGICYHDLCVSCYRSMLRDEQDAEYEPDKNASKRKKK